MVLKWVPLYSSNDLLRKKHPVHQLLLIRLHGELGHGHDASNVACRCLIQPVKPRPDIPMSEAKHQGNQWACSYGWSKAGAHREQMDTSKKALTHEAITTISRTATYASAIGTIANPWYASTQNARDETSEYAWQNPDRELVFSPELNIVAGSPLENPSSPCFTCLRSLGVRNVGSTTSM